MTRLVIRSGTLKRIFHITSRTKAAEAVRAGVYVPDGFDADGFVHCSYARQVPSVAEAGFHGRSDLVLLEIDREAVSCEVRDENLKGGVELFPSRLWSDPHVRRGQDSPPSVSKRRPVRPSRQPARITQRRILGFAGRRRVSAIGRFPWGEGGWRSA